MVQEYKQGDSHNALRSTLTKNGEPIDLTECKVFISVEDLSFEDDCIIVDAQNGVVAYPIGRVSHQPGFFAYEYVIKYKDGTEEIVPNKTYKKIRIRERIKE